LGKKKTCSDKSRKKVSYFEKKTVVIGGKKMAIFTGEVQTKQKEKEETRGRIATRGGKSRALGERFSEESKKRRETT